MRRDEALVRLTQHRSEFAQFDVKSLALFGSVARDEASSVSDFALLVDFNGPATLDRYFDLKVFLESLLQVRVDLVTLRSLRPRVRDAIASDLVNVT